MVDQDNKASINRQLASVAANCLAVLTLLTQPVPASLAQGPTCSVPVTVQKFDLSSFPKEYIDRAVAWRQGVHPRASGKPGRLDMGDLGYATTDAWTSARDIPPEAFVARQGRHHVPILSVRVDSGPRRVVFVAENGEEMSASARKIEVAVITGILSKARAEDSFALLTARGPLVAHQLGSRREVIEAAAQELDGPVHGKSTGGGVLDALLEATDWLRPARAGDSIFILARRIEGPHKASFSRVRSALRSGSIRLFGFQLGPKELPGVGDVLASSFAKSSTSGEFFNGMFPLSTGTGGAAICEDTEGYQYGLREARLQQLRETAEQMYNAISEYFVLELGGSGGSHLSASLLPEFQRRLLVPMDVLYPRNLAACSTPARAKSEPIGTAK